MKVRNLELRNPALNLFEVYFLFFQHLFHLLISKEVLLTRFKELYDHRDKSFGNGRLVRNIFEKTIENRLKLECFLLKID